MSCLRPERNPQSAQGLQIPKRIILYSRQFAFSSRRSSYFFCCCAKEKINISYISNYSRLHSATSRHCCAKFTLRPTKREQGRLPRTKEDPKRDNDAVSSGVNTSCLFTRALKVAKESELLTQRRSSIRR